MESKHKSDYGQLVLSAGKFYGDAEKDKGEGKPFFFFQLYDITGDLFELLRVRFMDEVHPVCLSSVLRRFRDTFD